MSREMLINVAESEECRVAVVENGSLEELYIERASLGTHVGNIYKGKVVNIESGIQAAFIDYGTGKNGFLHKSARILNLERVLLDANSSLTSTGMDDSSSLSQRP